MKEKEKRVGATRLAVVRGQDAPARARNNGAPQRRPQLAPARHALWSFKNVYGVAPHYS